MRKIYQNLIKQKRGNLILCGLFSAAVLLPFSGKAQQTFTFTSAASTGSVGPSQTQVNTAYFSTNLNGSVVATAGIQSFTIPASSNYLIDLSGASGGNAPNYARTGGLGARMQGQFFLTAGTVLQMIVGQRGQDGCGNGGGGGGSYVVANGNLLIAAGGGGGCSSDQNGVNGTTLTAGTADSQNISVGGTNGTGGSACSGMYNGAGGGGYIAGGTGNGISGGGGGGGLSFLNGGTGGASFFNSQAGVVGGFGGGGGGTYCTVGGGGGGGYSGGAGGQHLNVCLTAPRAGGGGGGSFNGGTSQVNTIGFQSGDGRIIIQGLCFISLTASGPTPNAPVICAGNSVTLTTNAVSNYTWSNNNTSTTSIVVSPNTTTTYSVIGTSTANCQSSNLITVTVSPGLPVLSIANPSNNICLGRTVSLTATGALTYTWTNPGVVNGQTFTPSSTAVYTVSGQNGCGITVGTTTITVAPLPVTTAVSPTLVCEGYPATLTAVSAVSGYTWQPGPLFGAAPITAVMVNTIYTVTASDGTCSGTATISLLTKPTPTITAATSATKICEGESVTLTASGAGTGGSYNWTPGGAGSQITMSPVTSSLFAVSGSNSVNCSASAQQVVVVVAAPPMSVVANKTLVCIQSSAVLTASGANSYTWTNGPFVGTYTVTPTSAMTIYTVIGSHQTNTCLATRTIAIAALIPNVTVTSTTGICEGASATLVASGATTYSWNGINNGTSGTFQPTPPVTTVYNLIAFTSSANVNCPSYHTATVVVYANPTIVVTPGKQTICKGETHTLTATGAVTYSWSTTPGTGSVITVKPNATTSYAVAGIDANGCENSTSYTAKVSACVGISEMQGNQEISVYPNPSTGEFVVSTTSDITLKVVNSIGQEVRTLNLYSGNDHKAQVKDLSSGVYFIVGENAEGKVNQKIIITK